MDLLGLRWAHRGIVVFRRCARHLFQIYLNDGYALVVVTSMLFGAYHGGRASEILSRLC
jgi:hypothetical protein